VFLFSPEADTRPGDLQAQVPWTNAFWFADREARQRLTKGSLANKGRSVLRLRRTGRTRTIARSQGNGGFSLADSQPTLVCGLVRRPGVLIAITAGTLSMPFARKTRMQKGLRYRNRPFSFCFGKNSGCGVAPSPKTMDQTRYVSVLVNFARVDFWYWT